MRSGKAKTVDEKAIIRIDDKLKRENMPIK